MDTSIVVESQRSGRLDGSPTERTGLMSESGNVSGRSTASRRYSGDETEIQNSIHSSNLLRNSRYNPEVCVITSNNLMNCIGVNLPVLCTFYKI